MSQTYLLPQHHLLLSHPEDKFDAIRQKLNDLLTDQRLYHATAKLHQIANIIDTRQQSQSVTDFERDSSLEHTASSPHRSVTPDEQLSPQRAYFRNYWRNLPSESPKSLSPTPSPPPVPASWHHVPRTGKSRHDGADDTKKTKRCMRKNTGGRITKPNVERHSMITRSRAKPGHRFRSLSRLGRPP